MELRNLTISNLGSFTSFTNSEPFKKNNIIFGTNGSGKSTLVGLLQSIQYAKKDQTILKAFIKQHISKEAESGTVLVKIESEDKVLDIEFNSTTDTLDFSGQEEFNFRIFNEEYTQRNIGDVVSIIHQNSDLVLGEANKELDSLKKKEAGLEKQIADIKTKALAIIADLELTYRDLTGGSGSVQNVISVENLLSDKCAYVSDESLIVQRQNLGYSKPEHLVSPIDESIISFPIKSDEVEKMTTEICYAPNIDENMSIILKSYTSFFSEGVIAFEKEGISICPFCRREWNNSTEIISKYKDYLSSAYTKKRKAISEAQKSFDGYKRNIDVAKKKLDECFSTVKSEGAKYGIDTSSWVSLVFDEESNDKGKKALSDKYDAMEKEIHIKHIIDKMENTHREVIKANNRLINEIFIAVDSVTASRKRINAQICQHLMKKEWEKNAELRKNINSINMELNDVNSKIAKIEEDLPPQNLNQKIVNELLEYIGLNEYYLDSENRLCLKIEKSYDISKEGKRISTAQKKIISLCYFFAEIISDLKDIKSSKDQILIFDDPVDSADYIYFHSITSVIEKCEIIIGKIIGLKKVIFGQVFVFTHNAILYDRLNCRWVEWKQYLEKNNGISEFIQGTKNLNNYLEYIKEIVRFLKSPKPDKRKALFMGNVIRRVLEIIASFDNLGPNSFEGILDGMGKTKLAVLANHLSHESFTKVLNPLSNVEEIKEACVELLIVIKERHPYQYETINQKYDIEKYLAS